MANENSKVSISSRWCFVRNELVISFPSAQHASEYHRMNHEGRIYAVEKKDVYLPRPEGLISLRSSSQAEHYSLALEFRSEAEARAWKEQVSISSMFPDRSRTHVYVNKWFTVSRQNPGNPSARDPSPVNPPRHPKFYHDKFDHYGPRIQT